MADEVVIRELQEADVPRVVEIALAAWEPIYAHSRAVLGEEVFSCVHADWRAAKAEGVRRGCTPGQALVAEVAGEVAAFVTFFQVGPEVGEIGNNAVHPEFQGQGLAGRLYQEVLARLRAQGLRVVKVTTGGDPAHAPARRAYEKAGFDRGLPSVTYYRKL